MSKYIKLLGATLLFFMVVWFPQKASAKTVYISNLGINVNVEEKIPDDATRAVIDNDFSGETLYDAGAMIFVGGDGKEYLFICNGSKMNEIEFRRYAGGNYFTSQHPPHRQVYRFDDGEWVFLRSGGSNNTWDTGIPIPWDTGLNLYIFREYTKVHVDFYDTVVWSPTDPTPTPLATPTPTPVPIPNVDVENSGITELFDGALRIFNVPMKIENIEFTWWQIFIYLILAGLVIDLIFAPSDK